MKRFCNDWTLKINKGFSVSIVGADYKNANGATVRDLVHQSIFMAGAYYRESNAQKIANARLLHSAPQMLEILQALTANPKDAEAWQAAHDVIAQATGKHDAEDAQTLDEIPEPDAVTARLRLISTEPRLSQQPANSQPTADQQPDLKQTMDAIAAGVNGKLF